VLLTRPGALCPIDMRLANNLTRTNSTLEPAAIITSLITTSVATPS